MRKLFSVDIGFKEDKTTVELLFPREERALLLNKKVSGILEVEEALLKAGANVQKDTILMDHATPRAKAQLEHMGYNVVTVRANL